jgi:hypothetical protein
MEMNKTNTDDGTTEALMIEGGYHQLSGEDLKQRVGGKTIWGDYLYGRIYISFVDKNGAIEGKNDIGSHHFGEWSVNMEDNTFTVKWDGWDNWTGRAYDVDGKIKFYDSTTCQWRTTFKEFEEGKIELNI